MKCAKCSKDFPDNSWVKGETYEGIDYHHNPPEFLMDKWEGEIIPLCRKCHKELHYEIKKILNDIAKTLKFVNSEYWVIQKMSLAQKKIAFVRVFEYTKEWIKNGNSK